MERKMYKEKRQLSAEETQALFVKGHHGILSVNGDDGYPYEVPVNYAVSYTHLDVYKRQL